MMDNGQLILLLTTVIGFLVQLYRERRNRLWDLEDRDRKARELAAKHELITEKQDQMSREITERIDTNTQITTNALEQARIVKRRLEEIDKRFDAVHKENLATVMDTVSDTKAVVEETKAVVDDTHAMVQEANGRPHEERRSPTRQNGKTRDLCYQAIRQCIKSMIGDYFQKYPERVLEDRTSEGVTEISKALGCILKILDDYDLVIREPKR